MLILTIKTDQVEAQLCLYQDEKLLEAERWSAHRQLAETIHQKIASLLKSQEFDWADLQGIVCFKGPGSFTGLRIGMSVANALAYGVAAAVVSAQGDDWQTVGIKRLMAGENEVSALPEYGGEIFTTKPRK